MRKLAPEMYEALKGWGTPGLMPYERYADLKEETQALISEIDTGKQS